MTTASPASSKGRPLGIQLLDGTRSDGTPLYTRLYWQLREHILSGALGPGARLPSARMLAADLAVSRNTVESAYTQLTAEGFIERRVGAGTTVAATANDAAPFRPRFGPRAPAPVRTEPRPAPAIRWSDRGATIRRLGRAELASDRWSGPWGSDVASFPAVLWQRLLSRRSRRGGPAVLRAGDPQGDPALRQAIAEQARLNRGLRCDPDQVVIVTGTQQALDLAYRLLTDPGDLALFENPGYAGAKATAVAAGARIAPMPVDQDGLVAEWLPAAPGPTVLYVTPSHQFPLGVTMSLPRRLATLAWADATGAWILEDDYDSEFRYDGRPIAALQGLDRTGRVIYLGTYNKVLFPGLRLGYLILPPALVDGFVAARRVTDGAPPPLLQSVLAEFLSGGHLAAHLRAARQHYASKRDALIDAIGAHWGDAVAIGPSGTGLHLAAHLPSAADDVSLAERAHRCAGVGVAALSRYYLAEPRTGLLIGYGAAAVTDLVGTVRALAPSIRSA